jgi:signal transduction histidine kinase
VKIRTKERIVTIAAIAVIASISAMIWWTYREVDTASRQRQQASEIARELSKLRLLTFEYRLYHTERARAQWHLVAEGVGRAIEQTEFSIPEQEQLLATIRQRRPGAIRLFSELSSVDASSGSGASLDDATRRFEAQLLSRLLAVQQENFSDIFRLTDIASERIGVAQRRMTITILVGLLLVAAIKLGASWLINRDVLSPVVRLQQATKEVASGNWSSSLGIRSDDEIGELSKNFDAMTRSLRESFEKIEQGNRELAALNSELEAFSFSVSHDLRAPLRVMDGFSQALQEDYGDKLDENGRGFLKRIRSATERMGQLIDDLLGLSKITRAALRPQRVDVSGLARETAASLQSDSPGREVRWQIDDGMTMSADRNLMRIAMQNLLENAWKYTGKTPGATIHVGVRMQDGRQVFFVADNGAGFDMAYADKLFDAFQRLHSAGEFPGTGIGLAIVQRVIRRHKGDIWAEARVGEGATFFFTVGDLGEGSRE